MHLNYLLNELFIYEGGINYMQVLLHLNKCLQTQYHCTIYPCPYVNQSVQFELVWEPVSSFICFCLKMVINSFEKNLYFILLISVNFSPPSQIFSLHLLKWNPKFFCSISCRFEHQLLYNKRKLLNHLIFFYISQTKNNRFQKKSF